MSCCARCGQGICSTAGKIALNKAWHKGCFCCYSCNRPLHVNTAKIYYGEVFCSCCCPQDQELYPMKICRVNSTPSFNPGCCPKIMMKPCCDSSDSDYCRPRDVHSCGCIPACCTQKCNNSPCDFECDEPCPKTCQKRIYCRPRSPKPKPCNYPPRQCRSPPPCRCSKCCPKRESCYPPRSKSPRSPSCSPPRHCCRGSKKRVVCYPPCPRPCESPSPCKNSCSPCKCCCGGTERCRRCGEKVFAAEKILTSYGAYHLGCFSCYCCCKSLCVKTMYEAGGEIYCRQCYNSYFGVSGYGYTCC